MADRGAVHLWRRDASGPALILPDGCLDVIVRPDGVAVVAGPDVTAREHDDDPWAPHVFAAAAVGTPVTAIAERAGLSARTLQRRSHARFGYGPQHLVRVLRLQRVLAIRRRGSPWAGAAAEAGYVDQPHLARECRALTGRAPTRL